MNGGPVGKGLGSWGWLLPPAPCCSSKCPPEPQAVPGVWVPWGQESWPQEPGAAVTLRSGPLGGPGHLVPNMCPADSAPLSSHSRSDPYFGVSGAWLEARVPCPGSFLMGPQKARVDSGGQEHWQGPEAECPAGCAQLSHVLTAPPGQPHRQGLWVQCPTVQRQPSYCPHRAHSPAPGGQWVGIGDPLCLGPPTFWCCREPDRWVVAPPSAGSQSLRGCTGGGCFQGRNRD